MNSTSSSDVILSVEKLNMAFDIEFYGNGNTSFRDFFVGALKSPYDFFFKKRDKLQVLNDISFELKKGERVGIVGINGAGKTTLCRCVAKMLTPVSGKVKVNGEIRSIFNSTTGVNAELTGRENAHILARLLFRKLSNDELIRVVEDAIEFSELRDFIDIPFKSYSKGMQTRLCLSIISAKPTDLLILDEVLEGADQFFREKISQRMSEMIMQSGAVIFVSHSVEEIERVCNRLILLDKNKILFDGSVKKGLAVYKCLGS